MNFNNITATDLMPSKANFAEIRREGLVNKMSFFNVTGVDIYIVSRTNHVQKIESNYLNNMSGKLVIRTNMKYGKIGDVTPPMHISGCDEDSTSVYTDLLDESSEFSYNPEVDHDYVLTLDRLKEADGSIYLNNLDIVISLTREADKCLHPYSKLAAFKKLENSCRQMFKVDQTQFFIRIVDNTGMLTPQYVKIGGSVQIIHPVKDLNSPEGVQISQNKFMKNLNDKGRENVKVTKLENHRVETPNYLEPLIFPTYEGALNFKNTLDVEKLRNERVESDFRKKEMEHREREITLRNREKEKDLALRELESSIKEKEFTFKETLMMMENSKRVEEEKLDSVKREHNMKITMEKNKQVELELRVKEIQSRLSSKELEHKETMMRLKEDYERRSNGRKNTSELFRAAPAVIAGIATIAGIFWGAKR